jgi:hypothetical protein
MPSLFHKPNPRNIPLLRGLPQLQRAQLVHWLVVEGISYRVAIRMLREKFGVVTSMAALSAFWHSECESVLVKAQAATKGLEIEIKVKLGGHIIACETVIAPLPEFLKGPL